MPRNSVFSVIRFFHKKNKLWLVRFRVMIVTNPLWSMVQSFFFFGVGVGGGEWIMSIFWGPDY